MPPPKINLKEPGALEKCLDSMVQNYYSIHKVLRGLRLMERHLKIIFANPDQVTPYHIAQCRDLEKIEMAQMRLAITQLTMKQIKFVDYMRNDLTRQEKFMLVQNPKISIWAEKLSTHEIDFVVSAFPMMSTVLPIRKYMCARIYPYLLFHEKDVLIETYDTRNCEYWDEDQPCTLQILRLPLKKAMRYRILIWVQICGGFKEIAYNHKMSEYNLFVYTEDESRKCLQFNAVDGVNLQRREVTPFTHFATFKTAEICTKFKEIGELIADELKHQSEKTKRAKEKLLRQQQEEKEQEKIKKNEQNNNQVRKKAIPSSAKKLEPQSMRGLLTSVRLSYQIDAPDRKPTPLKILKDLKE